MVYAIMQSLREVPTDTIKNSWIKAGILSPGQNAKLSTGVRHNNRVACNERTGLPASIIDDLSALLMVMGKKVSTISFPISMASLADLVDMHEEREVFKSASSTLPSNSVSDDRTDDEDENDGHLLQSRDYVDVDELDPLQSFTLDEAKVAMERVHEFVCIQKPFVQQVGLP